MKKLKKLLSVVVFFVGVCLFAQDENTVLWEVSGNGLEKPSYLFGTIHLACTDDLKFSKKVSRALESVEQLCLELDMDDPAFMQKMQSVSMNPNMENISSLLSEKELNMLNQFFKENYFVDLSQLGVLKPFVLMSMVVAKSLDCAKPDSIESLLLSYAKANEWEVFGLETIQAQIEIFDQVEKKEQLGWLVDSVGDIQKLKTEIEELQKVYKEEDISQMLRLMMEQPEFVKLKTDLLDDRNKSWIDTIEKMAKEKPTFFAVGSAHLPSEKGVIALLKNEGYTVIPVLE